MAELNSTKLFLNKKNVEKFKKIMQRNKESGGALNFNINGNGRLNHMTDHTGTDYSIKLNIRGDNYEAIWHTHHYKSKYADKKSSWVVDKIRRMIDNNKTWDALYFFESDIIRIHPPSPQDVINSFRVCYYNKKRVSFVFTQEGIYTIKPKKTLCNKYESLKTYYEKNKTIGHMYNLLEKQYFNIIWGQPKHVTKHLKNNDSPKIKKLITKVQEYTDSTTDTKRIREYMNLVRDLGFKISFMKWNTNRNMKDFFNNSLL
tara:strand:+ start:2409 stop:3185 length:777 start_codon:yes stop_codon:yes gene_type:complete